MQRGWKIAGIATLIAILGVAAIGTVAFAQEDGEGFPFDFGARFREAVAEALGITVDEYDAVVEEAKNKVADEAVAEGWLTEEQATRMKERTEPGFGPHGMGKGFVEPRGGFMGRGGDSIVGLIAEELGLTVQELFAELQDGKTLGELASEKGIKNGDRVIVENKRGKVEMVALVTKRFKPFQVNGTKVHQVGLVWHWGYTGLSTGDSANVLTPHVGDANTMIPEYKAFVCDVRKA